jgi:hypothetical protein
MKLNQKCDLDARLVIGEFYAAQATFGVVTASSQYMTMSGEGQSAQSGILAAGSESSEGKRVYTREDAMKAASKLAPWRLC